MLDVHAPEHGIHNVREFFLHLFTITCGLLIALALENAAEAIHHRHERREAEESIRKELEENRDDLQKGFAELNAERAAIALTLDFVEARSGGKQLAPPKGISFHFSEYEIQDVAWRTAASTGVLTYMPYDEVERFAGAYREQDLLQSTEQRALNDFLELSTFSAAAKDPASVTPDLAKEALPYLRHAAGDLTGVLAVGQGTLASYKTALE